MPVDNFDQIKRFLKFEKPGEFYFVQLLRRQADDPMIGGVKDPSYHGNMHSRSLKNYYVRSLKELEECEAEIKKLCDVFNVRAYIRLNRRTLKSVVLQMLRIISEQLASGENFSSLTRILTSALGKTHSESKSDLTWILDLDEIHVAYADEVKSFLGEDIVIASVKTKHGIHFITHKFDRKKFADWWNEHFNVKAPDIHKDNPTILYVPDGEKKCL